MKIISNIYRNKLIKARFLQFPIIVVNKIRILFVILLETDVDIMLRYSFVYAICDTVSNISFINIELHWFSCNIGVK